MGKQITVDIDEKFLEEFLDKLIEIKEKECDSEDCIKIFGLPIETYKKVYKEEAYKE